MNNSSPLKNVIEVVLRRHGQFFPLERIIEVTGLPRKQVYRALQRLVREGHVVRYQMQMSFPTWRKGRPAIGNIIYKAFSTLKGRKATEARKQQGTAWDRAWKAIRVLRRFRKRDLMMTAGMKIENAGFLLKNLGKAGIVRPTNRSGRNTEWIFVHDPGPERPSWAEIKRLQKEGRR